MDELIDGIYAAAGDGALWPAALDSLGRHFGAQSTSLLMVDHDRPQAEFTVICGLLADPALLQPYQDYYGRIDPLPAVFLARPAGEVIASSMVWSERESSRFEFYTDYFAKSGLSDSLGATLIRDDARSAVISLLRERGTDPFSAADIAAFERVMPHLRRALQLHRQFSSTERARAGLDAVVDRLEAGVLLCDAAGRVWHRNAAAERIMARGDGLSLAGDGRIATASPAVDRQLEALLGSIGAGDAACSGGTLHAPRGGPGTPPYALLVSPMPLSAGIAGGAARGAMVVIQDPLRPRPETAQAAARFHLTPSETRLLASLLAGEAPGAYGARAGISTNTIKFHLRGLFTKMGAHSQADLVRIALAPAGPGAPS